MSEIRCIYHRAPTFPPADQHPAARRYGPITLSDGRAVFVDALGGAPSVAEIEAVLNTPGAASAQLDQHLQAAIAEFSPPPAQGKPAMKPAAAGLNVKEMMDEHMRLMGEIHQSQIALLQTSMARQRDTVTRAVTAVASQLDSQTDEFLSMMGQFTNDLG